MRNLTYVPLTELTKEKSAKYLGRIDGSRIKEMFVFTLHVCVIS